MKHFWNHSLLLAAIMILALSSGAQNENARWYFGFGSGLDFSTNPPTVLGNGALSTMEGCSTMSDASGNLLFYSDGITIWNQQHAIMANGTGLTGNSSTTQSALIVKQPGSSSLYYIFTLGVSFPYYGGPLNYSIVDMSLAAGMGSVTVKNMLLDSISTEKLAAVRHCNGADVWIVTHEQSNSNFRVFLLSSSGLNMSPIVSGVGTPYIYGSIGYIKASPNGRKLGACFANQVELYDFQTATGVVSNPLALGNYTNAYGCEFSPDGSKFYTAESLVPNNPVHQWDLCAGSGTAIVASHTVVGNITGVQESGSLQLAVNGKIYITRYISNALAVINNPNVYGTGCGFVNTGQSLGANTSGFGLQNCINDFLKPAPAVCYSSECNSFVSINPQAADEKTLRIYPNPVSGDLHLETKAGGKITILNPVGGIVFEGTASPGKYTVDMSAFSTGIYTVKLVNDKEEKTARIIKTE